MGSQTLFERIINQEIPCHKVSEGENWFAFLDIYPRREGHTLVIPKRGVANISQLDQKETSDLFSGMREVQKILSKHFDTEDFTICVHDGKLAGQEVPHVHIHVIPRTSGDGGLTLMSMWPNGGPMGGEPKHGQLSELSSKLMGA